MTSEKSEHFGARFFLSIILFSLVCKNGLATLHTNEIVSIYVGMLVCIYQQEPFLLRKGNNGL